MKRTMMKSKLHRACVTETDLTYEGSITIDASLCERANLLEYEKVDIYNCNTGGRFSTYVIFGKKGVIGLNGAAARLAQKGDRVIIVSFAEYDDNYLKNHKPAVLLLNKENEIKDNMK
jgi:aspartate 1-decarboxylase